MPKAHPEEFRSDVVALARNERSPLDRTREGLRHLRSLSAHVGTKGRHRRRAGGGPPTATESAELRQARKRIRLLEQEAEVMRRAVACLSRHVKPKMMYPLVLDLAAKDAPVRVPVAVTCRVLGLFQASVLPVA